jgi:hypothetical protein
MKNKIAILFIVIIAAALYGLTLRGQAGNALPSNEFNGSFDSNGKAKNTMAFELSPERGRFVHLVALGENHTFALNQQLAKIAYPDVGYYGNQYFSFFEPGIAYMALPFYLLGKTFNLSQVFSFGFISLVSILALLFLYKISREILKLPIWASLAAVLIFAFGSTAWSYAITLYQHHVTVFLMLSGFYAVWKFNQSQKYGWLYAAYAGIAYATSITIDSPNAILLMPVALYLIISAVRIVKEQRGLTRISLRIDALAGLIGFCLAISPLLYFNQYYLGSWHTLNGSLPNYQENSATTTAQILPAYPDADTATEPPTKNIVGFFREQSIPRGFTVLLFSTDRGLFVFAPIFLLALLGIYYLFRQNIALESGILLALLATNVLLYSSWGDPWGGWAYGPRYLIPSMSILSLFVAVALANNAKSLWFKALTFLLFAYSSAIALLGAITTNADPSKTEALALDTGYNFMRNWDFLMDGHSGSFLYITYFSKLVSLKEYFFIIYVFLLLLALFILAMESNES